MENVLNLKNLTIKRFNERSKLENYFLLASIAFCLSSVIFVMVLAIITFLNLKSIPVKWFHFIRIFFTFLLDFPSFPQHFLRLIDRHNDTQRGTYSI